MKQASAPRTRKADFAAENARLRAEVRALRAQRDKAVSARDATAELLGAISEENERLIAETREAMEKQIATAEILRIISISPTNLQPTFDAIAARATALSGAAIGVVYRFDGSLIHLGTLAGLTAGEIDALRSVFPLPPSRGTATARAILTREIVHIADPTADPEYPHERFKQFGTVLSVPMLRADTPLGAITVSRRHVAEFSEVQIALVQTFADQAVIAIENARLFGELQARTDELTRSVAELQALEEVLRAVNSSLDLDTVLATIISRAAQLSQADEGTIYEFDEAEAVFVPKSAFGMSAERVEGLRERRIKLGQTHLGRSALLRAPVYVQDVQQDPSAPHAARTLPGIHAVLAVPLLREDKVVGGLVIRRRTEAGFAPTITTLLQTFAGQAVLAIENARLLGELRQRTEEVAELNRGLEARVAEQVEELGRVGRLKRFLAPQLAELIVSQGDEKILESHRREIVVVFCDLRDYTAFTETAEPEDALNFLREYHGTLGPLVSQFEGTLDHFAGDGIMVFFNDPVPCPDPAERAVKMAMAMREAAGKLIDVWRRRLGSELGFGAGIAQGYATLGQIGFSDHSGYTATGTVCNLAARLCAEAKDGQILVSRRIAEAVKAVARLEDLGNLELRGLRRPVAAFNVVQSTSAADARPNLTVVARGSGPN